VELAQTETDLCCKEFGLLLSEALHLHQVFEEFATLHELHDKVDAEFILEDEFHPDEEWVVIGVQDIFFEVNILDLLILQD